MNPLEFHDPDLQSFESRLGAVPLRLAPDEQQRMLYECAFAAGKWTFQRSVRVWQATTVAMGLMLAFVAIPREQDGFMARQSEPQPTIVGEKLLPVPLKSEESGLSGRPIVSVNLDAWQLPVNADKVWRQQLAQSDSSDHPKESFTMGEMLRSQSF